ncbi:MAG: DEAD/DEAH box helicase [Rhodanobacter sp.]
MTPTLRDYQIETVDCIFKEWETVPRTLAVVPTGGGKTAIAAEVIRRVQPAKAMFVCHREELVWQARKTIERFSDLECGIEMADLHVQPSLFGDTPVVIATIQTLNSAMGDRTRMGKFNPDDFGVLICDEFHHSVAKTWQNVMHYMQQNPKLRVLGITGTPDRADEKALGQVCDSVAIDIEILDLIHSGWLVPVEQQFVSVSGLDFSAMRTTAGDLNGADLAAVMESESNMQGVAAASIQIIGDKRTIVFTASVKQAEVLSNIFNRHKTGISEWVCGATNKDQRRDILSHFETGKIQIVCNCGVLTEGFDEPTISCVLVGRPTKFHGLFVQMVGRGTRKAFVA